MLVNIPNAITINTVSGGGKFPFNFQSRIHESGLTSCFLSPLRVIDWEPILSERPDGYCLITNAEHNEYDRRNMWVPIQEIASREKIEHTAFDQDHIVIPTTKFSSFVNEISHYNFDWYLWPVIPSFDQVLQCSIADWSPKTGKLALDGLIGPELFHSSHDDTFQYIESRNPGIIRPALTAALCQYIGGILAESQSKLSVEIIPPNDALISEIIHSETAFCLPSQKPIIHDEKITFVFSDVKQNWSKNSPDNIRGELNYEISNGSWVMTFNENPS